MNVMASETSPAGVAWKRPLRSGVCGRDRGPSFNLKSRGHCQGHWLWEDSRPGDTSLDRHLTSQIGRVLASRLCYSVTSSQQSLEAPFHTGSPRAVLPGPARFHLPFMQGGKDPHPLLSSWVNAQCPLSVNFQAIAAETFQDGWGVRRPGSDGHLEPSLPSLSALWGII